VELFIRMDMASQSSSEVMLEFHPSFHEMLNRFEDASRRHAAQLESWSEEAWARTGQLRSGGRVVLERPAGDIVWLFHFDEIHHRGQLSTYPIDLWSVGRLSTLTFVQRANTP
jgi:uncharacterized damage-inducible protein DinB